MSAFVTTLGAAFLFAMCRAKQAGAGPPPHAVSRECAGRRPQLSKRPFVIEWSQGGKARRLDVHADGVIIGGGKVMARIVGNCIIDAGGKWSISVTPSDDVDTHGDLPHARFVRGGKMEMADGVGQVGEILVADGESGIAISDDGQVWSIQPKGPAFSIPGRVSGLRPINRRTALLLFVFAPKLDAWLQW